jgi:hypothetical protein
LVLGLRHCRLIVANNTSTAKIELNTLDDNITEVIFTMTFVPKMGLLGRVLIPLMKIQFRKDISKLVDGNKMYVEEKAYWTKQKPVTKIS